MKRLSDKPDNWETLRAKIIGLGEQSIRKSYYPELQKRLADLELFRTLLDQSIDAIFLAQVPSGNLIDVNESACRQLGYSRKELLSRSFIELILPPESDQITGLLTTHMVTEHGVQVTAQVSKKNGDSIPVEMTIRLVELIGSTYAVAVMRDITDRKRTEEALKKSEEQFRRITENARDMIYRMSLPDGKYEYVSPASIHITGYTPEECYDNPLLVQKSIHPDWSDYFKKQWGNLIRGEVSPFYEYKIIHSSGEERWVHQRNVLVRDENGRPIAIEGIVTDITARKRAEEELRESEERFRAQYHGSPTPTFTWQKVGENFVLVDYNNAANVVTNGEVSKFINKTSSEMYDGQEEILQDLQRCFGEKTVIKKELQSKHFMPGRLLVTTYAFVPKDLVMVHVEDITESKRAEEALRTSETKYSRLYNSMMDAYVSVDMKGNIKEFNTAFLHMLGYDPDELKRAAYEDLTPKKWHVFESKIVEKQVLQRGYSDTYEKEYQRKDGTVFPVELRAYLTRDHAGIPDGMWVIVRDITDRKQAEEALRESERHLSDIIEFLPDATLVIDKHGRVTAWNKAIESLTGFGASNMIGKGDYEYAIPFYGERRPILIDLVLLPKQEIEKKYSHIIRRGDLLIGETDVPVVRGQKRFLSGWAHPIYDASGQIVGAIESIRDITDKRRAEEALEESETRYRLLAENASDIIFTMNKDLRFTYISPSVERIRGFTVEEAMKQTPAEILTPASLEVAMKAFQEELEIEARNSNEPWRKKTLELEEFCKNSSTIWTETTFTPLQNEEKRLIGFLGITRDITERKKSDEEKKRLENQLTQAQKMESIGTLAGGIAHDFNNILSAIFGYTELAIDDVSDPTKLKRELKEVLKAGDRAKDLVGQILTFSRKTETTYSPIALRTVINESLKMLRSVIPTTIEIRQDLSDSGLVMSNPTQINQVMMNLCTNAVHAMDETGGVLQVSLKKVSIDEETLAHDPDLLPGPYLVITVSDMGHGMPPDVMERIFEPYFTTKELGRGTGLGLSVVHGIVKSHKGAITCRSVPGEGTTFEIYLPEILSSKDAAEPLEENPVPRGTERILFIDDEPVLVELAKKILGNLGYEVIGRTSSAEALELFQEAPDEFDLIITDMTMPGMTGERLAQEVLKVTSDIPIILCTGYSEHISEERAKRIGIRKFLLKPLEVKTLAEVIRNVLDDKE